MPQVLALGERIRPLLEIFKFIRSLGIDAKEAGSLLKMALALFQNFTIDGLIAFIEALTQAVDQLPQPPAGEPGTLALNTDRLNAILQIIMLFLRFFGESKS